jgi:hypothetical protein
MLGWGLKPFGHPNDYLSTRQLTGGFRDGARLVRNGSDIRIDDHELKLLGINIRRPVLLLTRALPNTARLLKRTVIKKIAKFRVSSESIRASPRADTNLEIPVPPKRTRRGSKNCGVESFALSGGMLRRSAKADRLNSDSARTGLERRGRLPPGI